MELATASTKEFRSAVRNAVFLISGAYTTGSWTNRESRSHRRATKRYVGFAVHGGLAIRSQVAEVAEKILQSHGLTAHTRSNKYYVRGTCELV